MSEAIRRRRGTTAEHSSFTGLAGEITIDTTKKVAVVHDGATAGGFPLARQDQVTSQIEAVSARGANEVPGGRLTLQNGVAVSVSDMAGSGTVFYVPAQGNSVPIFNGLDLLSVPIGPGLAMTLDGDGGHAGFHQSGRNFDVFVFNDAGTIRIGTGPAWQAGAGAGSDVSRGSGAGSSALEHYISVKGVVKAIWVNAHPIALRYGSSAGQVVNVPAAQATYVGTIRPTFHGQVDDTQMKRLVFNAYNQTQRKLVRTDPTATWAYSAAVWRQSRGSTDNKIEVLAGLDGVWIELQHQARVLNSAASNAAVISGIGVDQVASNDADMWAPQVTTSSLFAHPISYFRGFVPLGLHAYNMLEFGSGADTQTWYGNLATSRLLGTLY